MEDVVVEEPILDIDVSDAKNSLAAVEYVQDLYAFHRQMEVKILVFTCYVSLKQQKRALSYILTRSY